MYAHARRILTRCNYRQLSLAITLCLLVVPTHASTLKSSTIESFIASLQDMRAIFDDSAENELAEEFTDNDDWNMDLTRVYSDMVEELGNHPPTQRKVSAVAERHGFESLEQWGQIGDRIFTAYMAINMEGQPAMDTGAMENYMASIENLPEADKQNIRTMMEGAVQSNEVVRNAPVRDIEAVRPYIAEITALHEMEAR
ncbi:hypothetical protein CLH62_12505 [Marinobacter guineae]|uniref:DUF2059 domain-containing protein n=1 Tax=Marinobacter guineae TaxID=432303 RepID=A0A2G1VEQ3_9GAMM|nr:hypothetical protein [Marinobacter guineae]PHQ25162.1 hypothetical protein CLH62_12505 [Marinobacter guineae]